MQIKWTALSIVFKIQRDNVQKPKDKVRSLKKANGKGALIKQNLFTQIYPEKGTRVRELL